MTEIAKVKMTLANFKTLTKRDFENGAVRDEIQNTIDEWEKMKEGGLFDEAVRIAEKNKALEAEIERMKEKMKKILDKFISCRYDYEFKEYMISEGIGEIEAALGGGV